MAKIGIACDLYKLEKFEEELKKADILYEKTSGKGGVVFICCISEQHIVQPVVEKVTQFFIDRAKNNN